MRASMRARSSSPAAIVPAGQAGDERLKSLQAHSVQPPQFGDRLGVVVDAQVQFGMIFITVYTQRGRLLASFVATRGLAGGHRLDQPLGQRPVCMGREGIDRRTQHLRPGQHVAGDAASPPAPDARTNRCRPRRCAPRRCHGLRAGATGAAHAPYRPRSTRSPHLPASAPPRAAPGQPARTADSSVPASPAHPHRAACARTGRPPQRIGSRWPRRSGLDCRERGRTTSCDGGV